MSQEVNWKAVTDAAKKIVSEQENPPEGWVWMVGREQRSTTRETARRVTEHGQRKVTTVTTETTEEPYVLLSCGHAVRGADFDARGKQRQRVRCWDCEKLSGPLSDCGSNERS